MLLSRRSDLRDHAGPEIFATVQGEGASIGVPSVFVRLAECNLRCTWCDTKYTWDWDAHDRAASTTEIPVAEVAERVREVAGGGVRNVVFTGGEPLLQQDELAPLATTLREAGFTTEVETNGTIVPGDAIAGVIDQWNVSPKLATSGNAERARHRPKALAWFGERANAYFKFVVVSAEDLEEVRSLVGLLELPASRVILNPEGTDAATLADRSRWLAERCGTYGYRLGARLHVFLWGNERGR